MHTTTTHEVAPQFEAGDTFDVSNLTTGWISRYEVLRDVGFDEHLVRIRTGVIVTGRRGRPRFRASQVTTELVGGLTLAVLRRAQFV
jgi:hypothetical protein